MSDRSQPIHETDVFIVGSGPAGCTYARILLDKTNQRIFMAEMGVQHSEVPGENLKNSPYFQKNPGAFTHVIQGHLHNLSPGNKDLPGASATYAVGGMATHWTCATPRPHEDELPDTYDTKEWDRLYTTAEKLIQTDASPFEDCVGQQIVADALRKAFNHKREIKSLPLAVKRQRDKPPFIKWSGCDTIMDHQIKNSRLTLKAGTHVQKLLHNAQNVTHAQCYDLNSGARYLVKAKVFVVCCGAILSPQLLHASNIGGDNVGRYLTDHPVCFTQIVLADEHLNWARRNPEFSAELKDHLARYPSDRIPIPFDEPEPQLYTPYTRETPWHTQIHREAFQYGAVNEPMDSRLVIHLRWYAKQDPQRENRIQFLEDEDIWGMPKPIFICSLSEHDKERNKVVFEDMIKFANALGPYVPGAEPHWRPYGQALHVAGTTRVGYDPQTSVLDPTLRAHGYHNIYVGGNNTIPTASSVNPTLTAMAYAVKGVEEMIKIHGFDREARSHAESQHDITLA